MKENKGFAVVGILASVVVIAAVGAAGYMTYRQSESIEEADSSQSKSEESDQDDAAVSVMENACFSMSFPAGVDDRIKFTDTSTGPNDCRFVIQYEGLGDTPVAVGEVFVGDYAWEEELSFITEGFDQGTELDLLDLGRLRGTSGPALSVYEESEEIIDGLKARFYSHTSNRSISGYAHSAAVEAPSTAVLAGKPMSSLLVWGASNELNGSLMEEILKTVDWK